MVSLSCYAYDSLVANGGAHDDPWNKRAAFVYERTGLDRCRRTTHQYRRHHCTQCMYIGSKI